ncbi:SDR family NAD(P)-dependent oxidoreductase [Denitratisoma oestradiolicum]|uniref:3-oxoacyl-[acyl-carrier protein] reductase n=1 Tax=Denitratisoma oestradiolicum TaxID=311182 RepID=A0A6S6XV25_9PROT|nr:SDR family NAD(P)-dependent oxidoreductase [Denitratisoma oestradiolicum]CAB1369894.1 3-oxoacyl-[acyl-carrier protein] reductase [Denitratisoma oestradiolicum]
MHLALQDRVVVLTGAASGIGLACLKAFATEGCAVVAADIDRVRLDEAVAAADGRVVAQVADVTDPAQVQALVDRAIEEFGCLDVMFNNAGGAFPTPTETQSLDDYRRIIALNLDSVYYGIHAALPVMLAQGRGCILSTTSGAGLNAVDGLAAYGAAKAGVISLMKSVATEFGGRGIRANTLSPGPMDTPGLRAWLETFPDGPARYGRQVPSGRLGTGEDIAHTALFLASDAAAYINGVVIPVDGAIHARLASPHLE